MEACKSWWEGGSGAASQRLICEHRLPSAPSTGASGSQTPTRWLYVHKTEAVGALWLENITEQPRPASVHYRGNVCNICLRGHGSPLPAVKWKSSFSLLWPSPAGDNNVSKCHRLQRAAALLFVFKAGLADSELQASPALATARRVLGLEKGPLHQ